MPYGTLNDIETKSAEEVRVSWFFIDWFKAMDFEPIDVQASSVLLHLLTVNFISKVVLLGERGIALLWLFFGLVVAGATSGHGHIHLDSKRTPCLWPRVRVCPLAGLVWPLRSCNGT